MQKPVYAFIDSQNLNLGVREQGWVLDFKRFRVHLKDKYGVQKAFLFIGYISGKQSLYTYLKSCGYVLIFKPTVEKIENGETAVKGNVDAELVLHCMIQYPNYGAAVIVSGDGDFYCLAEYLLEKQKLLKIITPNQKYSSLLRKFSAYISIISLFRKMVEERGKK